MQARAGRVVEQVPACIQIAVTILSISVHLFNTRNTNRKESVIEIITIYVIGLSGWSGIMSGLLGHNLYADEVATSIGWPLTSGFQMELGFASIVVYWDFLFPLVMIVLHVLYQRQQRN